VDLTLFVQEGRDADVGSSYPPGVRRPPASAGSWKIHVDAIEVILMMFDRG
jgi:hypothetical protein